MSSSQSLPRLLIALSRPPFRRSLYTTALFLLLGACFPPTFEPRRFIKNDEALGAAFLRDANTTTASKFSRTNHEVKELGKSQEFLRGGSLLVGRIGSE